MPRAATGRPPAGGSPRRTAPGCRSGTRPRNLRMPRENPLSLSVDVLVAGVELVDVRLVDGQRVAELPGEVHCPGDVLGHDGGLDRGLSRWPDGEDAVVAHEHRR